MSNTVSTGQGFEDGLSRWFWDQDVDLEVEIKMLSVSAVIIWRLDWGWRILFQMVHSHSCGQETVAPYHMDISMGLLDCLHKRGIWIPPEWVIQDSKTEVVIPFMANSPKFASTLSSSLLLALLAVARLATTLY